MEVEAIADEIDTMAEDLSDVETLVFDEWENEDDCGGGCCCPSLDDDDDTFFEIACPSCGEDIVIGEEVLDIGEVTCPNCGDKFAMELTDETQASEEQASEDKNKE